MRPSLTSSRVAIVSGKGGVGKTTVAAALAWASAEAKRQTLLLEIEGRNAIAPLFGVPSLGYAETTLAPNLRGEAVVPDEALVEYLYLFYGIKRIGKVLANTRAIDFATNVAPGLRDILYIGKVKEAERRRAKEAYAFDLIVLDAPPTGRLPRFLDAPRAVADLVRGGPIRTQAQGVLDMITDPARMQVVLVTLPEDMPATETIEASHTLASMGVALGPVVVNRVAAEPFTREEEKALVGNALETVGAAAERRGLALPVASIERLATVAGASARRTRKQRAVLQRLRRELVQPIVPLPTLFSPSIVLPEVQFLARVLADEGAVT